MGIGTLFIGMGTLITALCSVFTLYKVLTISKEVNIIEIATNSMKDQLVAATALKANLEGQQIGRDREIARQQSQL